MYLFFFTHLSIHISLYLSFRPGLNRLDPLLDLGVDQRRAEDQVREAAGILQAASEEQHLA